MLRALGYAGFGSDKLDDWRQFGTSLLGFQAVERGNSLLAFRMDDRKQRVVIDRAIGDGARFFGWEVADGTALDALARVRGSVQQQVLAERVEQVDQAALHAVHRMLPPSGRGPTRAPTRGSPPRRGPFRTDKQRTVPWAAVRRMSR